MPTNAKTLTEPRKSPVQARSVASVDSILQATIQVLRSVGKDRLTTTRVAHRAGVSVGTLYQYFPNKSALLKAALYRHLERITVAVEQACHAQQGNSLQQMAEALVAAFLQAKFADLNASVVLYAVSSDFDGAKVRRQTGQRFTRTITAMLESSSQPLNKDPVLVASMIQGAMAGITQRLLESPSPEKQCAQLNRELTLLVSSYLEVNAARR